MMQQILERVYTDNELLEMPAKDYKNVCSKIHDVINEFLYLSRKNNIESVSIDCFTRVVAQLTSINAAELTKRAETLKLLIDQASNESNLQQTFPNSVKPKKKIKVRVKRMENHCDYDKSMKEKYPDWNSDFWVGDFEFIWGMKSYDCLVPGEPNIHTMNDIEIDLDHSTNLYSMSIETAYIFKNKKREYEYLDTLLSELEKYMDENDISKEWDYCLYLSSPSISLSKAESISELYVKFKMFVEGFKALYGNEEN